MKQLKPEEFTFCNDSTRHNFDVESPDSDVRVDYFADDDVGVTYVTRQGPIPVWHGRSGHLQQRVYGLMRVSIECKKSAKVAVRVATRAVRGDVLDYTPATLVPPRMSEISLKSMIRDAINEAVVGENQEPFDITAPEEQDFRDDDDDDYMGEGYMIDDMWDDQTEEVPIEQPSSDIVEAEENTGGEGGEAPPSEAPLAAAPAEAEK